MFKKKHVKDIELPVEELDEPAELIDDGIGIQETLNEDSIDEIVEDGEVDNVQD